MLVVTVTVTMTVTVTVTVTVAAGCVHIYIHTYVGAWYQQGIQMFVSLCYMYCRIRWRLFVWRGKTSVSELLRLAK